MKHYKISVKSEFFVHVGRVAPLRSFEGVGVAGGGEAPERVIHEAPPPLTRPRVRRATVTLVMVTRAMISCCSRGGKRRMSLRARRASTGRPKGWSTPWASSSRRRRTDANLARIRSTTHSNTASVRKAAGNQIHTSAQGVRSSSNLMFNSVIRDTEASSRQFHLLFYLLY